jgi:hypothetical protein
MQFNLTGTSAFERRRIHTFSLNTKASTEFIPTQCQQTKKGNSRNTMSPMRRTWWWIDRPRTHTIYRHAGIQMFLLINHSYFQPWCCSRRPPSSFTHIGMLLRAQFSHCMYAEERMQRFCTQEWPWNLYPFLQHQIHTSGRQDQRQVWLKPRIYIILSDGAIH